MGPGRGDLATAPPCCCACGPLVGLSSEPPKRGRKNGAARKLSKSVKKLFDVFWRFLTFFCPARKLSNSVEKLFDTFFWRFLTFLTWAPFRRPLLQSADFNQVSNGIVWTTRNRTQTTRIPKAQGLEAHAFSVASYAATENRTSTTQLERYTTLCADTHCRACEAALLPRSRGGIAFAISRTFIPSTSKYEVSYQGIFLLDPGSEGESADLGVGAWAYPTLPCKLVTRASLMTRQFFYNLS